MFEDSLVESTGRIQSKSKYWMIVTFGINGAILATLILIPLLYPEALPKNSLTASLTAPPPPPPVQTQVPHAAAAAPSEIDQTLRAPAKIPKNINMMKDTGPPPPPGSASADLNSGAAGNPASLFGSPTGTGSGTGAAVVAAKPKGPVRISSGVVAGNKISGPTPVYPAIARSARLSGAVTLSAVISKTGTIENLTVVSGPAMLTGAAIDAVKQWRYKPYILNGEPTEVSTTITVNFNLNSGG